MKLILHAGPPKTGTTALQRALFNARESLLDKSVLYPDPVVGGEYNHGRLCYIFLPFSIAPRGMRKLGEADYLKAGRVLQEQVVSQTKEHSPGVLILSSEWFAQAYHAKNAVKFIEFAESLGPTSIEILLYARRPSEYFLSSSQQRLRASSRFEPIFDWNMSGVVDGLRALAPQHTVTLRAFDRPALVGGSIVSDFAAHCIPECKNVLDQSQTPRGSNESFSAEAMVILQDFRRTHFAGQEDIFSVHSGTLLKKLQKI